jgi:predicted component of viral defense system (DUF524 family)
MAESAEVALSDEGGNTVAFLRLYPQAGSSAEISVITEEDARNSGEERVQLLEGGRYEYELEFTGDPYSNFQLNIENGSTNKIILPSRSPGRLNTGTLCPGLNTGRMPFCLLRAGAGAAWGAVEVKSRKLGYRDDYRRMLEAITSYALDLLLELRSPSQLKLMPNPGGSPQTIAQRFAFLKALLDSRQFQDALQRVVSHPHQRWEAEAVFLSPRRGFKPNRKSIRQIANATNRIPLSANHPLGLKGIKSLPQQITAFRNMRNLDTAENRFIKHILENFVLFLNKMRSGLSDGTDVRLILQLKHLSERLENVLSAEVFTASGSLEALPLGSPVLQRKEGYRELFQAWLNFDLAARLVWRGGEDVYGAGKRDVAVLYEYWVFFKLLDLICKVFHLEKLGAKSLIEETADGFGLKLKSGRLLDFIWNANVSSRKLRVRYSYNRSFNYSADSGAEGSWTERMRPDYTLSIWPCEFSPESAENQELMSHVHFDAKYRIEDIQQLFGLADDELAYVGQTIVDNLDVEKRDQLEGRYKRADLLKMHSYKDAIRRTQGAYVIYPGTASRTWRGFHEIFPGLGAFPLRPDGGDSELEDFLGGVAIHACYRASAQERHSYHTYEVYRADESSKSYLKDLIHRTWPETDGNVRAKPPSEIHVLIGLCESEAHFNWIRCSKVYNLRMGSGSGPARVRSEVSSARYLLVHSTSGTTHGFFRIGSEGPRIFSKDELVKLNYPSTPSQDFYLLFDIDEAEDFLGYSWDYGAISVKHSGGQSGWPQTMTLDHILSIARVNMPAERATKKIGLN